MFFKKKQSGLVEDILELLRKIVQLLEEILKRLSGGGGNGGKNGNGDQGQGEVPVVDFRFGDQYTVTYFIQVGNPTIKPVFEQLYDPNKDRFVEKVAEHVKRDFAYPLDQGQPAAGGLFCRFEQGRGWQWQRGVEYMWSFPAECLVQRLGICIDTSNYAGTLLRWGGAQAKVCLGSVHETKSGELLGYHAWIEVHYKGEPYVLETTIHPAGENLIPASAVYNKQLSIYYVKEAEYDETGYREVG